MWVIGMEDRDAAQLKEVMLTISSRTQEAPPSLWLQLLSIVDRIHRSIWLSVLQLINIIARTVVIYYNDNQSKKTHCIWQLVYSKHRMLVCQPLNNALLLTADIHHQDKKGGNIFCAGSGKRGIWAGQAQVVGASIPSCYLHWNNKEDKKTSLMSLYYSPCDYAPSPAALGEDITTKRGFKKRESITLTSPWNIKIVTTYNSIDVGLEIDLSKCLLTSSLFVSLL